MRQFLLICAIFISPIFSQNTCPTNLQYGVNCTLSCSNCAFGCDISGSCINSTCRPGFYGNICNLNLPQPNIPSIINFATVTGSCRAISTTLAFNTSLFPNLFIRDYYVIYGTDAALGNNDPSLTNGVGVNMPSNNNGRYEVSLPFGDSAFYRFAVYFTFEDVSLLGVLNSSMSPVYRTFIFSTNCSSTDNAPNVPTITSTTPTPMVTSASTVVSKIDSTMVSSTLSTPRYTSSSTGTPMITDFYVRNMRLVPSVTSMVVSWDAPVNTSGLTSYSVSINSGPALIVLTNTVFSYIIPNLNEGTSYLVTVTAIYNSGAFPFNLTGTTLSFSSPTGLSYNKTSTIISWTPPVNTGYTSYKIYNNSFLNGQVPPNVNQYLLSNLQPGTPYTIAIAAVYATREANATLPIWTKPSPFTSTLGAPVISNIGDTSFSVTFPTYTNYNGSINIYMIAVQATSSVSRQKRDTFSCSPTVPGLPSGASVRYANNANPGTQPIVIGSGTPLSTLYCANDKLQPSTSYTVYAIVGSLVDTSGEYTFSSTTFVTAGLSAGAIAGIIIAILLLIILIILLVVFLLCRKKKQRFFGIKGPYEDSKPMTHCYWSNINDKMQSRKIILENKNITEGVNFKDEYDNLPKTYCDDHVGVEMSILNHSGEHGGDRHIHHIHKTNYIASYIDGYIKKKAFMSLQTPYDDQTIADFWLMIYSDNVGQIVMMTKEGELLKQNIYWPMKTDIYDLIEVTLVSEDRYAYFDVRTFKIRKIDSKENIRVTQYHYRSWPINDKLVNIPSFLEFHQLIKRSDDIIFGPTIVHSQLDCPLNAVYIGFDILNDQLSQENEVNVYRIFAQLRRYRPNMMVTIDQYNGVYDFLFESYVSGRYVVDFNLKNFMDSYSSRYWRFLEDQFKFLIKFKDLTYHNKIMKEKSYIFDGIEFPASIILSRLPSHSMEEVINFWDGVFLNDIAVIVDFQNRVAEEMPYVTENLHNYQISVKNVLKGKHDVMSLKLSVVKLDTKDTKVVVIYSINTRTTFNYGIEECDTWVELISDIMSETKGHLLVFDTDGFYLSSIFITCFNAVCRLTYFHYVSVYFTIKSLQASGHQIIETHEEYKFIFEFLRTWIEMKAFNGNYDESLKFDLVDPEFPFKRKPYGKFYPEFSNSSFNQYSLPRGLSYEYRDHKYQLDDS